ncbi:MAG: class I SAM-dependent rRNA methyltransferase [Isosphaeraceae bacterium]
MTDTLSRVVLRPRMARPFFARHPWVFSGSIAKVEGEPAPGDEVRVVSHEGQFIARGLFNPRSQIRARLYRWDDGPLDDAFWAGRIDSALRLRSEVLGLRGPCRLIFSEGDGLSGLTADRYGEWLVLQFTSLALFERRERLLDLLQERAPCRGILLRSEKGIADQEGLSFAEGPARGEAPDGPISVEEHGLAWEVDLTAGQKTGFYLDQRDNREAIARLARGRRMLDLFCYTGGFGLVALQHGAAGVLGIDSSARAIDAARRNAERNGFADSAGYEVADAFDRAEQLRSSGERFGLVSVDPPKFARGARSIDAALKAYLRLNRAAVDLLEPGGILATCSCSGLVGRDEFAGVLAQAAELSGRPIQILESRGQAADHPISVSCPESSYLKCLAARVG